LDLSPVLIEKAGANAPGHVVRADMQRIPFRSGTFDVVLSFFTSFGYFEDETQNRQAIEEMARVLRPGGQFVMEHVNRAYLLATLEPESQIRTGEVVIRQQRSWDEERQRVTKRISITDGEETRSYQESVRVYEQEELRQLLARAGLSILNVWGAFDGTPIAADSPRMVISGSRSSN
jgi:SAM-dependent methyltransferase